MSETCPICQRPLDPLDGKCGSDEAECLRIGYEREKALADAAEAKATQYERDWYAAKNDFGTAMAKSREALAAARRECEGLRKALRDLLAHAEWMDAHHHRFPNSAVLNARALIPPAAAPECEWRCDACGDELASETTQRRHEATWHAAAAPAAETCPLYCGATPAAPGSHHMNDCGLYAYPAAETTEALLRECDDVLARIQGHGCPPSDESLAALRAKLRARAAPPEGET